VTGHSRVPVYRGDPQRVVGLFLTRSLVGERCLFFFTSQRERFLNTRPFMGWREGRAG